jgi:hypothetical protein
MQESHQLPIWLFIGALLGVYGVIILATGIVNWVSPPAHPMAMSQFHPDVWWGLLMTVIGTIYCVKYWPWKKSRPE